MPLARDNLPAFFFVVYEKKRDVYIVKNFEPNYDYELVTPLELLYLQFNTGILNLDLT